MQFQNFHSQKFYEGTALFSSNFIISVHLVSIHCNVSFLDWVGMYIYCVEQKNKMTTIVRDRRGHDCMVVGFTTTCATSAYH